MNKPVQGLRGRRLMEAVSRARPASLDNVPAVVTMIATRLVTAGCPPPAQAADGDRHAVPAAPGRSGTGHGLGDPAPDSPPRRRRGTLAGIGLAVTAAAAAGTIVVATVGGQAPVPAGHTVLAAAMVRQIASASRSALEKSGRVEVTYKVLVDGVVEGYGGENLRFSGKNWERALTDIIPATGKEPKQTDSGMERLVDGQDYATASVHGRQEWIHVGSQSPGIHIGRFKIPDPRTLLSLLDPSARFQAVAHQVIGGIRLKELRATDPGRLTHLKVLSSLPDVFGGDPLVSLRVWVDRQRVVHGMTFTFRGPIQVLDPKPVSKAAVEAYQRAKNALVRALRQRQSYHTQTGKWPPDSRLRPFYTRWEQAYKQAFRTRQGTRVSEYAVTFSEIGQPQHITAPRHTLPECAVDQQPC